MMRNSFLYVLFVIAACFSLTDSFAQTTRSTTTNTNAWLMYFGNHKLADKWGLHAEVQLRRHEFLAESQQLLLRTGVDYYTSANNRFTAGYAFIKTYPYGEFAVPNAFPEHRLWQQFLTTQSIGKSKLSHRYRLEQRWIGNAVNGTMEDGRYENRVRYMAKLTIPLNEESAKPLFLAFYDELMVNFGKEVAYNIFDQNRLYGALGFTLSSKIKIEAGYLFQLVQLRSLDGERRNRIENNHTFQLGIFSTLPFYQSE